MIPEKVMICGIPHKVIMCDDDFNLDLHFGQIKYEKAEIKINRGATEELQMQTLFHEMLHGMLMLIGRNEEAGDEGLVQGLANAMYQSFRLREDGEK